MEKLRREGVALAFDETGQGEPPIILVHGWCCDHTYFAPQLAHFGRAHRTVAVDLRGHGQSDKPVQDYTMDVFADDVAWIADELQLSRPVIVGHSMGGVIAFELAARHPDLVGAVVALDAPLIQGPRFREMTARLVEGLKGSDHQRVAAEFIRRQFIPTDGAEAQSRILQGMLSTPQHVMASAAEHLFRFEAETLAATRVPALVVNTDRGSGAAAARLEELNPRVMLGQAVGTGHFLQLIVPEQVNAMIDRFLQVALPA